jgi:hypothetical protein
LESGNGINATGRFEMKPQITANDRKPQIAANHRKTNIIYFLTALHRKRPQAVNYRKSSQTCIRFLATGRFEINPQITARLILFLSHRNLPHMTASRKLPQIIARIIIFLFLFIFSPHSTANSRKPQTTANHRRPALGF